MLEAIREPSEDIAPIYINWGVKLRDGREGNGIDLFIDNKSAFTLVDATGKQTQYKFAEVVSREPLPVSLMPPGLLDRLSESEVADLLAFLRESRD